MTEFDIRRLADGATIADAHAVRRDVFVDGQDVPEEIEMDGKDEVAFHVVAYDGDRPVGTARTRLIDDETAKFERVAVRADYRGRGLGRALMAAIEEVAREEGAILGVLHGQTSVESFYEELGYETTSDVFYEADIPHVKMERSL